MVKAFSLTTDSQTNSTQTYIFFPFFWEQGLRDNVELIWFPLPFELKYEVFRNEKYSLGLDVNIFSNILYQFQGFNWTPYVDIDRRSSGDPTFPYK